MVPRARNDMIRPGGRRAHHLITTTRTIQQYAEWAAPVNAINSAIPVTSPWTRTVCAEEEEYVACSVDRMLRAPTIVLKMNVELNAEF